MTRTRIPLALAASLCLGAFAANAAGEPSQAAASKDREPQARSPASSLTWGRNERDGAPKSSRLRFRTPDGTCACSCARGGITEDEIRKSQEARERTRS